MQILGLQELKALPKVLDDLFPVFLRHNCHTLLCKFNVYCVIIWLMYTVK